MPKIDIAKAQVRTTSAYPDQFKKPVEGREKTVLGDLAGLTQFGVNRTKLPPGVASSLRHWHEQEDEFIYVLEGCIEVHLQFYTSVVLKAGQSIYIDSTMGHAYVAKDCDSALILAICSSEHPGLDGELIDLAQNELGGHAKSASKSIESTVRRSR